MNRRAAVLAALALLIFASAAAADELDKAFDLARRTLAFVQRAARPRMAADLAALEQRFAGAKALDDAARAALYADVRALRRRLILSHPLLDFDRLLINKRTAHLPGHMCDQYLGRHSRVGPGLAVLDSWKDHPTETLLLQGKLPPGAVLHPDLSYDGRRVLFSFCDHSVKDAKMRAYFIYEAALDGSFVRQLTGTPADPLLGDLGRQTVLVEDLDPACLPDGGFVFTSTRSQQYGRCHGDRYVPSYVLYRADADGSHVRRISFNEANEWDPAVMHDGSVIYTRWDYINRHDTNFQSLWLTRPDGAAVSHFYGNYSVGPCMIAEARAIPGSHKVLATATDHHGFTAGSIIVIDPYNGQDGGTPLLGVTPELSFPERGAPKGTLMAPSPLAADVPSVDKVPGGRRAATPYPLSENLFLLAAARGSQYAIYLVDTLGGRELIYDDPDISCFAPIPVMPTVRPPVVPSSVADTLDEKTGRFYVQDVYQSTQPIERGSIKRLRVSEIISQPTRAKPILSYVDNEIIKRILGTVPVQPDGSVAFEAPANTPLQFQLLDSSGMAVMTMRSLVYLQPGERASCVGCHEPREESALSVVARRRKQVVRQLEPPAGPRYDGGLSFTRTVQPVLDRYCIGCHGLDKTEAGVDLVGTFGDGGKKRSKGPFTVSYHSLLNQGKMVVIAQRNGESNYSKPKDYFAHAGRLAAMLLDGHKDKDGKERVRLPAPDFQRIVDWLDLNAQFYGDYSFNRSETLPPDADGEKALRQLVEKRFGPDLARQPFAALVNVALPAESRILLAPLPLDAGGWGQMAANAWTGADDPAFKEMLAAVRAAVRSPDHGDVAGTCGSDGKRGCRCGNCWVRQANDARRKAAVALAP